MRDITPDNMKLLHKVQSHILKCRECRDVYDKLLRVKQVQDDIVVDNTLEEYASEKYEVNKTGGDEGNNENSSFYRKRNKIDT